MQRRGGVKKSKRPKVAKQRGEDDSSVTDIPCLAWIPTGAARSTPIVEEAAGPTEGAAADDDSGLEDDPFDEDEENLWETESEDSEQMAETIGEADHLFIHTTADRDHQEFGAQIVVYDDARAIQWTRQEFLLPNVPLSITWLRALQAERKNLGAMTYFGCAQIEIWNLDLKVPYEPDVTLGGCQRSRDNTNFDTMGPQERERKLQPNSHRDSVLDTSWNSIQQNFIASGSQDCTVKLWDLTTGDAKATLSRHSNCVHQVHWHPTEASLLLSGAYEDQERSLVVSDCRQEDSAVTIRVPENVEEVKWYPQCPEFMLASTSTGYLRMFDVRQPQTPVFNVQGHASACSTISFNPHLKGLVASGGHDRDIKLWDLRQGTPRIIVSENLAVGKILTLMFHPNDPSLLAGGGSAGRPLVWDVEAVAKQNGYDVPQATAAGGGGAYVGGCGSASVLVIWFVLIVLKERTYLTGCHLLESPPNRVMMWASGRKI